MFLSALQPQRPLPEDSGALLKKGSPYQGGELGGWPWPWLQSSAERLKDGFQLGLPAGDLGLLMG